MAFRILSTAKERKVGPLSFSSIRKDPELIQRLGLAPKQVEELAALKRRKRSQRHGF